MCGSARCRPAHAFGVSCEARPVDGEAGLAPGTVIDGRYRVDSEIGAGGFATVYAGQHLTLNVPVAIKVLRLASEASLERRAMLLASFSEEARLVMRLRHDNIVRTLDQGVFRPTDGSEGEPYVVLEWCGDESLAQLLERRERTGMSLAEAYRLIEPISAGMAHAHELGIAHRDLKPSNVMLARDPRGNIVPRIIDFGIAKAFEVNTTADSGVTTAHAARKYTPAYAAPEQVAGLPTGPWTDVHALGLIFVELLVGALPYTRSSLGPIDPNRPTPKRFGVEMGPFEAIIGRAVAFDPRHRYADARELLSALRSQAHAIVDVHADTVALSRSPFAQSPSTPPAIATGAAVSHTVRHSDPPRKSGAALVVAVFSLLVVAVGAIGLVATAVLAKSSTSKPRTLAHWPRPALENTPPKESTQQGVGGLGVADLERRLQAAGATPTGRDSQGLMKFVHFTSEDVTGTFYLNRVPLSDQLPAESRELATLPTVKSWIEFDRKHGLELVYGIQGGHVMSLTGESREPTLALFEKLTQGLSFKIRGSSFGHPDPATQAADARSYWRAKTLAEIDVPELASRVSIAGATVTGSQVRPRHSVLSLTDGKLLGQVDLFVDADGEADELTSALKNKAAPFAVARGGNVRVVSQGGTRFGSKRFLATALDGVGADFK